MATLITRLDSYPSSPDLQEDTYAYDGLQWRKMDTVTAGSVSTSRRASLVEESISEVLEIRSWSEVKGSDPDPEQAARDRWQRQYGGIFRYFFRYPSDQRSLVHAFCAAVRDDWSSTVRDGGVPSAWDEQQADDGTYLLQYDARMAHAIQYGQEEGVARESPNFGRVSLAKVMSPSIDWVGMELTDRRDGTKALFEPGELHLTDDAGLQDRIGTQVTRADLIDHWGLTFS